ncbi:MAG: TadE/TadG family type IV pilus assembly protein [bacterium]|nr:TadE/TadG family type IV pilus assembly protein [bacterium]
MRNNKGQALVEFIIVLPLLLLIIMSIIDFGNIITKKYSLQNELDVISDMYLDHKDVAGYVRSENIDISITKEDDITTIKLDKNISIISPILNIVFGKNYLIEVEKSIYVSE